MSAGALSSFVPDSRERRGLMEAVGETCEQQGQFEQARELYLAAPNPCAALRIMNRQLSDLIPSALTDTPAREFPAALATLFNLLSSYCHGLDRGDVLPLAASILACSSSSIFCCHNVW